MKHQLRLDSSSDGIIFPEPRLATPFERRQTALQGTPAERSEFTREISLNVDVYRRALRYMESMLDRMGRTKTPGGLWLLGHGGQGKTFILTSFFHRHPPTETTLKRHHPVMFVELSSRPTISEILLQILLLLGQPPELLRRQKNNELQEITERALIACDVKMICFDEAQHLWLSSGQGARLKDRFGGLIGDFLKRMYDRIGIPYVFAGTPGLKDVILVDEQVATRWAGIVELKNFEFNDLFIEVLMSLDEALPMPESSSLFDSRISQKLFDASKGNFRRLKTLMAEAVFVAASETAPKVTERHLAQAYFQVFCDENTPFGLVSV